MNSKVGFIKVKAFVKPQHNNAVNCKALEVSPEMYGDLMATLRATSLSWPTLSILPVACCSRYSLATIEQAHKVF